MKKAHLSQGESEGGEVGVQQYSPCRVSCHWWKKQHQQQGRGKQLISVFSDKPNQKKTKTNKTNYNHFFFFILASWTSAAAVVITFPTRV